MIRLRRRDFAGRILLAVGCLPLAASIASAQSGWTSGGQNLQNTRFASSEDRIGPGNVAGLQVAWTFTTGGNVSATPAVDGSSIYFPDWAGYLYKLDNRTGAVIWSRKISDYTGVPGDFARTTPAIAGDLLIFGDQGGKSTDKNGLPFAGAKIMAVNKNNGNLVWLVQADDNPASIITQSAQVFGDTVFVGVSSSEELYAATIPGYKLSFRGSMLALNKNTGAVLWRRYLTADGFTGVSVWGSTPSIDPRRGQVYIGTGNNYSAPQAFLDAAIAAGDDPAKQQALLDAYPDNHFDSILALDMKSGAIDWSRHCISYDVWTVACIFGVGECPHPSGPDADFGQAPMLYTIGSGRAKADVVGVGQKSGVYWTLNADNGDVIWHAQAGPPGTAGGLQWGSAFDGNLVYTSNANSNSVTWQLPDKTFTKGAVWTALNPITGQVVWQVGNPTGASGGNAASVANGVVYLASQDKAGFMYALSAATGKQLWSFASGGSCNAGAAIVKGTVYWGSGYTALATGTPNNKFYAFRVP